MAFFAKLLFAFVLVTFVASTPVEASLPICNGQFYNALEYTCYDDEVLCPFKNGWPIKRCGKTQKCYSPYRYGCKDGDLFELQRTTGPYSLMGLTISRFTAVPIQACGLRFWVTDKAPCTLCSAQVGGACPPGKETVFAGGRSMQTTVPGGQRFYIDPSTGALSFSLPHSGRDAPNAIYDIGAIQEGSFGLDPYDNWLVCPTYFSFTSPPPAVQEKSWQVFAKLPNVQYAADCFPIMITTVPWNSTGSFQYAAWEYI